MCKLLKSHTNKFCLKKYHNLPIKDFWDARTENPEFGTSLMKFGTNKVACVYFNYSANFGYDSSKISPIRDFWYFCFVEFSFSCL